MNRAEFHVADSCIGCGKCVLVCPGGVLSLGEDQRLLSIRMDWARLLAVRALPGGMPPRSDSDFGAQAGRQPAASFPG